MASWGFTSILNTPVIGRQTNQLSNHLDSLANSTSSEELRLEDIGMLKAFGRGEIFSKLQKKWYRGESFLNNRQLKYSKEAAERDKYCPLNDVKIS